MEQGFVVHAQVIPATGPFAALSILAGTGFLLLAAIVGFYADRTSICTVKAISEVLTTRRAWMLLSFGKTALWVIGITSWLAWLIGRPSPAPLAYQVTWLSLAGGLLFGIGAVFNRGCALATLKRLGNGNLGMLVSLAGFAAGATSIGYLERESWGVAYATASPLFEPGFGIASILVALVTAWMLWEAFRIRASARRSERGRWSIESRLRLSTAAAIIGISNGILYALLGTWSYTHTLRRSAAELLDAGSTAGSEAVSLGHLWYLFLALVLGVLASAAMRRRFAFAWRPQGRWRGYFGGGLLMGTGAALIPGGNDVLLLNAIPGFSPHAIPAYAATLTGVAAGLYFMRWRGQAWDVIDCRGDLCAMADGRQPN